MLKVYKKTHEESGIIRLFDRPPGEPWKQALATFTTEDAFMKMINPKLVEVIDLDRPL